MVSLMHLVTWCWLHGAYISLVMAILTSLFLVSRSAEGRPMDKAEWELLQRLTADLHTEFDNVQMRFDDSPTSDSYSESMNQMNSSMNNNSSNWELERAKP